MAKNKRKIKKANHGKRPASQRNHGIHRKRAIGDRT